MSSKIRVADVLEAIAALPAPEVPQGTPTERGAALLARRGRDFYRVRLVIYRFDAADDSDGAATRMQQQLQSGHLPVHEACRTLDADMQLIELGAAPAEAEDNARACAFGMMAAEESTDMLIVAAFGAGPQPACDHRFPDATTPAVAALTGAIIGAARAGIPVIAEGPAGLAAAHALHALRPDLCATLVSTESDGEPGHAGALLAAALILEAGSRNAA